MKETTMETWKLENLKGDGIGDNLIHKLYKSGLCSIYDLQDMINNGEEWQLKRLPNVGQTTCDKIVLKVLDFELPERSSEVPKGTFSDPLLFRVPILDEKTGKSTSKPVALGKKESSEVEVLASSRHERLAKMLIAELLEVQDYTVEQLKTVKRSIVRRYRKDLFSDILANNGTLSKVKFEEICNRYGLSITEYDGADRKKRYSVSYKENVKDPEPKTERETTNDIKIKPLTRAEQINRDINKIEISQYDLSDLLLRYVYCILDDIRFPKFKVNYNKDYPIDTIIFNDDEIYIKGDFLESYFNDFISKKYKLNNLRIQNPFKYAIGKSELIYSRVYDRKRYSLNYFPDVTGNDQNYIKIFRKVFNKWIGRSFYIQLAYDPYVSNEYLPDIDLTNPLEFSNIDDTDKVVYSTSSESKQHISIVRHHQESRIIPTNNLIINSCHPVLGNTYIVTFSLLTRVGNDLDFETKVNIGTYQFDKNNKSDGNILISNYEGSIPVLKKSILSMI